VINPNVPGSYNLQYKAVDGSGNMAATFFATVVVKDLVPPTVTLLGANPLIVDVFTTFNDPGVTTSDNYYPNVTQVRTGVPTMNTLGTYTITYTVTDGAGNSTVVTRTVNVVDREKPEIIVLGKNPYTHTRFTPYIDPGVKLNDNYYSDAVLNGLLMTNISSLDVNIPGLYFIDYSVTDPSGNVATTVQRLVRVVEVTGISELDENHSIAVYPNPSSGAFTISNTLNTQLKEIKIVDVLGKVVLSKMVSNTSEMIQLNVQAGIYQLIIEDNSGTISYKKISIQ
jgi:hypothetical protein